MLDRPERVDAAGRGEPGEFGELHLADAMLGRDRAARGGHKIVDQAGDRRALALVPVGRGVAAGADVEMDVAVAEMAEAAGDDAGEPRSTSAAASVMNRGMSATGTEMSCASVWPSARSASEMVSRSFQKASACASLAAIAASSMMPC